MSDLDNMQKVRQELNERFPRDENGLWAIHGYDSNVDFGGSHVEPHLETVSGLYGNVVDYALTLPNFIGGWGNQRGSIRRLIVSRHIDETTMGKRAELMSKRAELTKQLEAIDAELESKARNSHD